MNTYKVSCSSVESLVYLHRFKVTLSNFFKIEEMNILQLKNSYFRKLRRPQIHERLSKENEESLPSIRTVERRLSEFEHGHTSHDDDQREGRLKVHHHQSILAKM